MQHRDLHVLEFGNIFGYRISQLKLALFQHHHDGSADYRLGHGGHAKHRVARHWLLGFEVHGALRFEIGDLPFASDQHHGSRNVARVDVALNHGMNLP